MNRADISVQKSPLTGRYRTAVGRNVRGGRSIPRADVAHYMLAVVGKPETTGQVIGIATLACGLRPPQFEHGNGADSSGLACVFGKARVAPRLLGVDAVAFSAGQFVDGHLVCLGSAFDTAVTGGGQVAVPVRVGGCSSLGCEDVDGTAPTGPPSAMDSRSDRDREARSTSLDDSVSILAASAPARGERGTGSHIRRTFVSLRGGGGYALRHTWTLEVVAPRPIRCGAAGS